MLFDNNNVDLDMDFAFLNFAGLTNNDSSDRNFFNAKEGFLRGNMFKNEYKPYKNLTFVNIRPKNDREAKLYNVMCYSFAINDMNLYLDVHPDDRRALALLKELIMEEEKAKKEYIMSYGPLNVCDTKGDKFSWIDGPWSWENMGGNMYV